MEALPNHLLNEILFQIDHKSLAMMRCTNKSFKSHINDPFLPEYLYRVGSSLLHISSYNSTSLCYHSYNTYTDSMSLRIEDTSTECQILDSCSGLVLLFIDNALCVANLLTKKFRFLNLSRLMSFVKLTSGRHFFPLVNKRHIGFAVDQIDRTTQSFRIVHMNETKNLDQTKYSFEINDGNTWRLSKTTITCDTSNLRIKNSVYFDGSLHWLRNDGSIVAFNPKTDQARLIPINFPRELSLKTLFTGGDNNLTLVSATDEVIYVYALVNILSDPKWVLVKQIRDRVWYKESLVQWTVEAYDGKCLVLREEMRKKNKTYDRVVHMYNLSTNKWSVVGSIPWWSDANQKFFQFTPSLSSVLGLDEILSCGDKRVASISSIIGLFHGISSEKVKEQLRERWVEARRVLIKKKSDSLVDEELKNTCRWLMSSR